MFSARNKIEKFAGRWTERYVLSVALQAYRRIFSTVFFLSCEYLPFGVLCQKRLAEREEVF